MTMGDAQRQPHFFRWLIPYHIAIMSTPHREEDISALSAPHLGIRHEER